MEKYIFHLVIYRFAQSHYQNVLHLTKLSTRS